MARRIPLIALQRAIYKRLTECQDVPVYDAVPDDVNARYDLPCITFGAFTYKPDGTKQDDVAHVTLQLDVWSAESGRAEVQQITNDVVLLIEHGRLTLDDEFEVVRQEIDFFEAFAEDPSGYHGVITLAADVLNTKKEE